jgi:anthranilate/para-aminobenzoate synthase component II
VDGDSLPDSLEISAKTNEGIVMGVRHKTFPVEGIQFHPESILTNEGYNIIKNWLSL